MKTAHSVSHLLIFVFILVSCKLLVSCKKDDVRVAVNIDDVAVNIIESSIRNSTVWSPEDIIGISAYISETNHIYDGLSHKQYQTFENGLFSPLTDMDKIIYPLNGDKIDFIAYYPYKPDIVNDSYKIDISDQTSLKAIDFLYSNSTKGKNKYSTSVDLAFNHQLSKIVIDAIPGNGFTEEDLKGISISLAGFHYSADFDLLTGSLYPHTEKAPIKMNTIGFRNEAIVLPGAFYDVSVSVILPGAYIYRTYLPSTNFLPGTIYHYRAKVNKTEVEIYNINIADWMGADEQPGVGSITETTYNVGDYYPNPSDSATAIGVVYWLSPGSNGKSGKIISFDTSEKAWSINNTQVINAVSIVSGIVNTNAAIITDPTLQNFPAFKWCTEKGEGWYLPGRYELHILREQWGNNESIINNAIAAVSGKILHETDIYLTSSENKDSPHNMAESYSFSSKGWPSDDKTTLQKVRAIKMF